MAKQDEFAGMPPREAEIEVSFLSTTHTMIGRQFQDREKVQFVITGYVREKGHAFLEDDDKSDKWIAKVKATSIEEVPYGTHDVGDEQPE